MDAWGWFLAIMLVILILLVAAMVLFKPKKKTPTDYHGLFMIGALWVIIGIPFRNYWLAGIGAIFIVVALANKHKWKKNKQSWQKLNRSEKITRLVLYILMAIVILAGLVGYFKQ
ncbi:MAG: hypothetical protein V1837_01680 [Candidatus Woesearchaeota archaeon]